VTDCQKARAFRKARISSDRSGQALPEGPRQTGRVMAASGIWKPALADDCCLPTRSTESKLHDGHLPFSRQIHITRLNIWSMRPAIGDEELLYAGVTSGRLCRTRSEELIWNAAQTSDFDPGHMQYAPHSGGISSEKHFGRL
jgi:hypothetical protein